jgi:hypothetical protein
MTLASQTARGARSGHMRAWRIPCMATRRDVQGGGGTLWLASAPSEAISAARLAAADSQTRIRKGERDAPSRNAEE